MFYQRLFFLSLLLLLPIQAHAALPGFTLNFFFTPPMEITGLVPEIMLDVCRDQKCTALTYSMPLRCLAGSPSGRQPIFYEECALRAQLSSNGGPDATMQALLAPTYLRLRMNRFLSAPFAFNGGKAASPLTRYFYHVAVGEGAFLVSK